MKAACARCIVVCFPLVIAACVLSLAPAFSSASAAELWIGAATADITPEPPVAQEGVNIATTIRDRCTANVLALESRQGERVLDQAVLVSCDLCILPGVQEGFRKYLAARQPGFDINKLSLAATHTHTSPMVLKSPYNDKDYGDAVQPKDYLPFLYQRMGDAVTKAWTTRAAGAVAWGLGHAVVGHNRRVAYRDGTAKMHGNTNDPEVQPHRRLRGSRRRYSVFLRCPAAAQGDGHYDGLYGASGRRPLHQRRFLARRARVASPAARARSCACWDSWLRRATRPPGSSFARRPSRAWSDFAGWIMRRKWRAGSSRRSTTSPR